MADIQNRAFSKDYSGLIYQSAIAGSIALLTGTAHELMKRKRRGNAPREKGLGSVESWEFGYLYQGRSWAKNPSPAISQGWPLSWVKQALLFPEDKLNDLRGVDAAFYVRFLRGCTWWCLLHSFTTLPILLPIHVTFAPKDIPRKSMIRADISSLVKSDKGLDLLWIHMCLLVWLTITWMANVFWICRGTFRYRAVHIAASAAAPRIQADSPDAEPASYFPHPHPQFPFQALPPSPEHDDDGPTRRGLRMRSVMITNLPAQLRSERELKEYFQYYLSRPVEVPSVGMPLTTQPPGLANKLLAFVLNRARRARRHIHLPAALQPRRAADDGIEKDKARASTGVGEGPAIDRVIVARKMSELASLLQRREDVLVRLETAHIKLARKALDAVREAMHDRARARAAESERRSSQIFLTRLRRRERNGSTGGAASEDGEHEGEDRMDLLIRTLGPFVDEFGLDTTPGGRALLQSYKFAFARGHHPRAGSDSDAESNPPADASIRTVWDALLSLPRSALDAYQPLIHLSHLFRGKTVPAIDYHTAKLNLLNSLVLENRARRMENFEPVSTAFVTFKYPADARRACKYLAAHPNNPLACLVRMAPSFEDLDWTRVMKSTYRTEFVKDWVVNIGVWAFTVLWLIPVSFFLTLVNVQSIRQYWPALSDYLSRHSWQQEIVGSFLPTLLVALLALAIPPILLLIAKKAHTIITLSELHDRILTRYYKFLILNVLVFFCVGTAALQSFLTSFKDYNASHLLDIIKQSFPAAGPFYVGWLIFTTGIHGGFEIALFGLPLIVYPTTRRQVTPRKRNVGIRPRTFNFYYWLPSHLLVVHVLLLFLLLNPLVIPFGLIYFTFEQAIVKNQLLHVYAKNYEGNGKLLMIRMIRYSFDGLILSQVVFLGYMVVLEKVGNIATTAVLLACTALAKVILTHFCRAKFEEDDIAEADAVCGNISMAERIESRPGTPEPPRNLSEEVPESTIDELHPSFWTWRLPSRLGFTYGTIPGRHHRHAASRRQPNPFGPAHQPFKRLRSLDLPSLGAQIQPEKQAAMSTPVLHAMSPPTAPPSPPVLDTQSTKSRTAPALVTQHPPHPRWDDESHTDLLYENPYYTRDIANVLWLPRDPCGVLNLDDTIEMHRSITSESRIGTLGAWGENNVVDADEFGGLSMIESIMSDGDEDGWVIPLVDSPRELVADEYGLTGNEEIVLPPVIAARVRSQESDVEQATTSQRRPSQTSRQRTVSADARPGPPSPQRSSSGRPVSPRRPSTLQPNASAGFRSFSSGSGSRYSHRAPSHLSIQPDYRQRESRASADLEMGMRPGYQAQASFTRSALSVVNSSNSHRSGNTAFYTASAGGTMSRLRAHTRQPTTHVSTHEAVVHEVIKEEADAAEERIRAEVDEEMDATQRKPWWKAWMFTSAEPPADMTAAAVDGGNGVVVP